MSYHPLADNRTYVYRIFDTDGQLIYVGATANPESRILAHKHTSWWYPQLGRIKIKVYPTRTAATDAEKAAIRTEFPRWNVNLRHWKKTAGWTVENYQDYVIALEHFAELWTPAREARVLAARTTLLKMRLAA